MPRTFLEHVPLCSASLMARLPPSGGRNLLSSSRRPPALRRLRLVLLDPAGDGVERPLQRMESATRQVSGGQVHAPDRPLRHLQNGGKHLAADKLIAIRQL